MASVYSASKYSATIPAKSSMGVNSISSVYTVGTVADGDVINVALLPAGAQVHKVIVATDKAVAGVGGTIALGYYTSASDESNVAYMSAQVATAAIFARGDATLGLTKTFTADTRIVATLAATSSEGTDVLCTFVIFYTMNP